MSGAGWTVRAKGVAVIFAIVAFGLAVRLVLVQVPPERDAPSICTVTSDFWRGDEVLC